MASPCDISAGVIVFETSRKPAFALASPRLAATLNHMKARVRLDAVPSPLRYMVPIWVCAFGLPCSARGRNSRIAGG